MHILYHQKSIYNAGGIERILLDKAGRLVDEGMDVTIVTTDSPPSGVGQFFPIPERVKVIQLGINYNSDDTMPLIKRVFSHFRKKRLHRRRLETILSELHPDIVITIHPTLSSFIPKLKDGSKKWVELHFARHFRLLANRGGLLGVLDKIRDYSDKFHLKKFDKIITLTQRDCEAWGKMPDIRVIPNYTNTRGKIATPSESGKVIAIGRLSRQKNFGLLLDSWSIVKQNPKSEDWKLTIFGDGPERYHLEQKIKHSNLQDSVEIVGNVTDIADHISESAMMVSTSLYEGFPMSILEGMAAGLPVIATNCDSGPSELIDDNVNGYLTSFSADEIANSILHLIKNPDLRNEFGKDALNKVSSRYSPEIIIGEWKNIFESI